MDSLDGRCWNCGGNAEDKCEKCEIALYCQDQCRKQDLFRHQVECDFMSDVGPCCHCRINIKGGWCETCGRDRYCSEKCQKAHWKIHEKKCLELSSCCEKIVERWSRFVQMRIEMPLYWGNSLAVDYLKLFQNEGVDCKRKCLSLLFAACGDLRHVVKTLADLPAAFKGTTKFHLNDYSHHVMARNVLFLFLSCTIKDTSFCSNLIVQLWYSLLLTEADFAVLLKSLETLTQVNSSKLQKITNGLVEVEENCFKKLQIIWKGWLQEVSILDGNKLQMQWLQRSRGPSTKSLQNTYLEAVPICHMKSLSDWFRRGLLLKDDKDLRQKASKPNITLLCMNPLNPVSVAFPELDKNTVNIHDWSRYVNVEDKMILFWDGQRMPFEGWDYIDVLKTEGFQYDVVGLFQNYLEKVIGDFVSQVQKKKASFYVSVQEFLQISECIPRNAKFDRIAASNLADYHRSVPILMFLGSYLNSETNLNSVLVLEYRHWQYRTYHVVSEFPEEEEKHQEALLSCIGDLMSRPMRRDLIQDILIYLQIDKTLWEYHDMFFEFLLFLRAEALYENLFAAVTRRVGTSDYLLQAVKDASKMIHSLCSVPKQNDIYRHGGIQMRKFWQGLNKVVPFRYKINARRINNVGQERAVEWIPKRRGYQTQKLSKHKK